MELNIEMTSTYYRNQIIWHTVHVVLDTVINPVCWLNVKILIVSLWNGLVYTVLDFVLNRYCWWDTFVGILCFAGWLEICRGMLLLAVLLSLTAFVCGVVGLCVHSHCSKRVWFLLAGALLSLVGKCTLYFSVVLCIRCIDILDTQRFEMCV